MVKVDGVRSLDALRELVHEGAEPEYLFFYGHTPSKSGRITASCLSQWWEDPFVVGGERYPTAEHFMMASKAELFGDHEKAATIRQAPDPKTAKVLGREVSGFDTEAWERHRYDIVVDGNLAKFRQHRDLGEYLLGTGDKVIVEASKMDLVWGSGLAREEKNATKPDYWRGLNLLGFALMEVRDQLRTSES
jgi:hypothetical protein